MPVLKARCEAEALCAQLNKEGHVDACLTADSDSFLFGAKCVIKSFKSNSKVSCNGLLEGAWLCICITASTIGLLFNIISFILFMSVPKLKIFNFCLGPKRSETFQYLQLYEKNENRAPKKGL